MHINVPTVDIEKLIPTTQSGGAKAGKIKKEEGSQKIRERVQKARIIQNKRLDNSGAFTNADMKNRHIKEFCDIKQEASALLKQAVNNYNLSARTYFRLIKISQTIADLAEEKSITASHVAEALQYRIRVEG